MSWINKLFPLSPPGPSIHEQYESIGIRNGLMSATQIAMRVRILQFREDEAVAAYVSELTRALFEAENLEKQRLEQGPA